MKTLQQDGIMKNQIKAAVCGLAFGLATVSVGHAMSELVSISIEPEWPATATPGTVILYKVTTVARAGQGMLEVALSSAGLPDGSSVTFTPSVLRFTGRVPTNQVAIMTVTCPRVMPTDTYPFTVTGAALRESITFANKVLQTPYSIISAPPVLTLDGMGNGNLRLRGKGSTGQLYQIESTPSLVNPLWTLAASSTADGNGRFTVAASLPKDSPMRFFRAFSSEPPIAQ